MKIYNFYLSIQKSKKTFLISIVFTLYIISFLIVLNKKRKLKRIISSLLPSQKDIINIYLSSISSEYINERYEEGLKLLSLITLVNYSDISNNTLKFKLKQQLLKKLQIRQQNKNIFEIKIAYVDKSYRFGNSMILLNNLLYYCEILNITNIYLNSKMRWPISENISLYKINISLIQKENIDFDDKRIVAFDKNLIYFQKVIKPEIRIDLLKNEIKKNLPKLNINPNDLYIHIRSGDIFKYKSNKNINYAQPPLCFYKNIINNFSFTKIFIVAQDKENPLIDILIKNFPYLIFTSNHLNEDLSILSSAYNIVASISSFLTTLIIINDNLNLLFEFDIYRLPEKYLHLHHDIYNYNINYSIYKMYPSLEYKNTIFPWKNSKEQIEAMINEKCNDFIFFQ